VTKQPVKCPKCQQRFECEPRSDPFIHCPNCGAKLRAPRPEDALLGRTLGEFEILELLGRGGMGAVYKGRQTSLDRLVAVKILPRAFSSDTRYVERFRREARSAAAVRHPNIIEIHAIGEAEGYPFIAMEFIDGETLRARLKREGRLEPQRAMDVLKQTASALERAHDAGILHRDIKPSNILIDTHDLVKVADFGLAKREHGDVSVTQTGHVLGTALYMPPETARGEPFDARSDLYSLGATFYHALASRAPFEAATTAELVVKHVEASPPPLQQIAPEAPPALCRIIHRLLRKNPQERYASATELLEALAKAEARPAAASAAPTTRGPRTTTTRPARGRRRPARAPAPQGTPWKSRLPLIAMGAAALVALAVIVAIALRARTGSPQATAPARGTPAPAAQPPAAKKPPPKPGPREDRARGLFESIQRTAKDGTWLSAQNYLDKLGGTYADTRFYAANRVAIDALRARIEGVLKKPKPPKPPTPKPEPPKPKPEPPKPKPPSWKMYTAWPFDAAEAKRRQDETAKALGVPAVRQVELCRNVKIEMVLIPTGEFIMGKPASDTGTPGEEEPRHRMRIERPFWIGRFEVTQPQWQAVMGANPSEWKRATNPVDGVSWDQVCEFVKKLNAQARGTVFALPTEAQWEYACRSGSASRYYFGDYAKESSRYRAHTTHAKRELEKHGWFQENARKRTHSVGLLAPNAWDLHDMLGNVWEWCEHWERPGRGILRGGGWSSNVLYCRCASRMYYVFKSWGSVTGLRLASSIP